MTLTTVRPGPVTVSQVARTGSIDLDVLDRVRHEVLTAPRPDDWVSAYGEYQSGGWETLSLINASGQAGDVTITDCAAPTATGLLAAMPRTRALLDGLGLSYMWARIARLEAGAYLWEHRDYGELSAAERYRLHIPLQTTRAAYLVLSGRAVHLEAGTMWRLTPTYAHGAVNLHGPARLHLILDCYANPALEEMCRHADLPADAVRALPDPTPEDLGQMLDEGRALLRLGFPDEIAERSLLRRFFTHAHPEGRVYDLIGEMYALEGRADQAEGWRARKDVLLGTAEPDAREA